MDGCCVADGDSRVAGEIGQVLVEAVSHDHPGEGAVRGFAELVLAEAGDVDRVDVALADRGDVQAVEQLQCSGGDASAARFVAGQRLLFQQEGGRAGVAEAPGGGSAGGSGPDHDGVPDVLAIAGHDGSAYRASLE